MKISSFLKTLFSKKTTIFHLEYEDGKEIVIRADCVESIESTLETEGDTKGRQFRINLIGNKKRHYLISYSGQEDVTIRDFIKENTKPAYYNWCPPYKKRKERLTITEEDK